MPEPRSGEDHDDFISRCMGDDEAVEDFPDEDQRFAFCESTWEESGKMNKSLVTRLEVKEVDEESRTFSGLAATWDLDLGGDVINKGAFKRTLKNWKKSKRPLPLLDSHNAFSSVRNVIGKMAEAEETDDGLEASFEVIEGDDGDEIFRRVKGGYVDGLSIGYQAVKVQYPETEEERAQGIYRYLDEVKLREVSVVLFPMNENARIDTTSMKAMIMGLTAEDRELEDDERQELKRLMDHITHLLTKGSTSEEEEEEEPPVEQLSQEALDQLGMKLNKVMADRLTTRIDEIRHSSRDLISL